MMPDVTECEPGREVIFRDPRTYDRRHGHLIAAGPRWSFVWDSPGRPCLCVRTSDVEVDEDPRAYGER